MKGKEGGKLWGTKWGRRFAKTRVPSTDSKLSRFRLVIYSAPDSLIKLWGIGSGSYVTTGPLVSVDLSFLIKEINKCKIQKKKSRVENLITKVQLKLSTWTWALRLLCARAPVAAHPQPVISHLPIPPLLCHPSFPTLLWCVVTRSAGSSSMTDCYFLERKRIWLLTSGPLQLQTRALYINQEVISKQRDHPPINLLGSRGITCSCNPG